MRLHISFRAAGSSISGPFSLRSTASTARATTARSSSTARTSICATASCVSSIARAIMPRSRAAWLGLMRKRWKTSFPLSASALPSSGVTRSGFRWGSLAGRGFGPEELSRINPRLICVDQASPIGFLTRVAPAIGLDRSTAYVELAGSFPGSSTLDIGWGPDPILPHPVPHRPTSIFRLGLARRRGPQTL
jgi:hypothetical protein